MTELRRRMLEEMRLRNYSPQTIEVYIRCVAKIAQHFRLSPDRLGPEHIREYQLFLVQERKASWALFNQTVCALRFFYHRVLHRDWMIEHIPYPRHEQKLPVVLSPAEVAVVFEATRNLKHRTILMTIYAAGLRVSEVVNLRLTDIDSQRQIITVRQGKGNKDRQVMLSPKLLEVLRIYWRSYRPRVWLFPAVRIPSAPARRHCEPPVPFRVCFNMMLFWVRASVRSAKAQKVRSTFPGHLRIACRLIKARTGMGGE